MWGRVGREVHQVGPVVPDSQGQPHLEPGVEAVAGHVDSAEADVGMAPGRIVGGGVVVERVLVVEQEFPVGPEARDEPVRVEQVAPGAAGPGQGHAAGIKTNPYHDRPRAGGPRWRDRLAAAGNAPCRRRAAMPVLSFPALSVARARPLTATARQVLRVPAGRPRSRRAASRASSPTRAAGRSCRPRGP